MSLGLTTSTPEIDTRPSLELSGEKLRAAFDALAYAAEEIGGIERFAAAVKLKSEVFRERLASGAAGRLELTTFEELMPLMATVRTRIGTQIDKQGWPKIRNAIAELLSDAQTPGTGDARVAYFCNRFPVGKETRFVRDFASELLHNVYPELYPLMSRWVWDAKVNTGVLREI